jgi:hypothetical protein
VYSFGSGGRKPDWLHGLVANLMADDRRQRGPGRKRCCQCGGKFGLARYRFLRQYFCSRRCMERYQELLEAEVLRRKTLFSWMHRLS